VRLAELIGTLSLATDVGTGFSEEHGLRAATLAVRLGELAGLDERTRADAYYLALLRYSGCTAGAHVVARVIGDEIGFAERSPDLDYGRAPEMMSALVANAFHGVGFFAGLRALGEMFSAMPGMPEVGREHCETAVVLARRMGFEADFLGALYQGFERWDGSGQPKKTRADAIALSMRLAQLALDLDRGFVVGKLEGMRAIANKHAGRELDPTLVARFLEHAEALVPVLEAPSAWAAAMDAEPGTPRTLDDAGVDATLLALADFTDLKSRYTRGHSRGVARFASGAAKALRLGADVEQTLYRAGLLHDLGRVAVSAAVWNKPGALTDAEWERVRMHTYVVERILSRAPALARIAELATLAHERVDGKGYHRRLPPSACSLPARILAAADVYQALLEVRPQRPAFAPEAAATELLREAQAGTLAREAVDAVLAAAGQRTSAATSTANLTARELEVLRLVARGLTNKEIAAELAISAKTAGRHLEHIYEKLGVTTRSGATMVGLERGLIGA